MIRLSKKDIDILEAIELFDCQDIEKGVRENEIFIDVLLFLQTFLIQGKFKFPEYKNRISTLASKTILNCNSVLQLLQGQILDSKLLKKKFHFIDIPSLFTLVRAQLETYLMFDFIYCQASNEKEIIFRYKNWILSGLLSRNEFETLSHEAKTKKKSDMEEINQFRKQIIDSGFLNNYSESQKRKILNKGEPRLFIGWNELMNLSNIHSSHSKRIYRLLSAHAHSTGLSIMNLDASNYNYANTHSQGHLVLSFSKLLLARFIINFNNSFTETGIVFNTLNESLRNKIEFYSKVLVVRS